MSETPFGVVDDGWITTDELEPDGDGREVRIQFKRHPAIFWRIVVLPTMPAHPLGELPGYVVETGSGHGMRQLAYSVGEAIADGMLAFEVVS